MVGIIVDQTILVVRPAPLDMDMGLLLRPFQEDAWTVLGIDIAVMLGCLIVPSFFISNFSKFSR